MVDTRYLFKFQKLVNGTITGGLKFFSGSGVSENITINSINFAVPGQSTDNNISMNLGGFTKLVSFSFVLQSNGTDLSEPSGDNIVTLEQQWAFIMDEDLINNIGESSNGLVQNPGVGFKTSEMQYQVIVPFQNSDGNIAFRTFKGMLEDIAIEPIEGEPRLRGRLTLNVSGNNPFVTIT